MHVTLNQKIQEILLIFMLIYQSNLKHNEN